MFQREAGRLGLSFNNLQELPRFPFFAAVEIVAYGNTELSVLPFFMGKLMQRVYTHQGNEPIMSFQGLDSFNRSPKPTDLKLKVRNRSYSVMKPNAFDYVSFTSKLCNLTNIIKVLHLL